MIKTISLCLIAAGIALLITAAVIFFRKGLLAVWKDMKTSRQAQLGLDVESVETDLYYNEILKKRRQQDAEKAEKQAFQKNVRKKAIDDSAILFEKERQEKKKQEEKEPAAFKKAERIPASRTDTGVAAVYQKAVAATEPLSEKKEAARSGQARGAGIGDTEPLKEGVAGTAPLEESTGTQKTLQPTEPLQAERPKKKEDALPKTAPLQDHENTGILRGGTDKLKEITIRESGVSGTGILYETLKRETDILDG